MILERYRLDNPFATKQTDSDASVSTYDRMVQRGQELIELPRRGGGPDRIRTQHSKDRMTVWERIRILTEQEPHIAFQNWGPQLDGASIVTGILNIQGRDVAFYGHDFTVRAGSMDATNGAKIARQILMAAEHGIPLIGMNDSAGAFVPAGVGGLDGYSEAFAAMRRISGIVPSIMLMFGYNAGGGAYLPRQGSFLIQPQQTFFGLTGPNVVREALGEDITPDDLGGPKVHTQSGVVDLEAPDELDTLRLSLRLLSYLPDNNHSLSPFSNSFGSLDEKVEEEEVLLEKTFSNPVTGFNTPLDMRLFLQQIVDHGDYFEIQPSRARQVITAFARLGGHVTGFICNNSAFNSGNIDVHASRKVAKFVRFCNLYNIPTVFLMDVTGFAPGSEQETLGIVQAGREMMDAIIDLRVPRLTLIVRNAFGGAYCAWNSYHIGADFVFSLPTARIAVMGPAGRQYIYKDDFRNIHQQYEQNVAAGMSNLEAAAIRDQALAGLTTRYEEQLLNPEEALRLGSVSQLVPPGFSRKALGQTLAYTMRHYEPKPMADAHRE
ncbi:MAG: acetyl-CoA carboxylase carboxyltransferase subunit [Deltaproteobacteria bacterium]|nr:acetyl-CoA carboxylase carboxyltransferase subunit [Deltaproteobacteria bacterium]